MTSADHSQGLNEPHRLHPLTLLLGPLRMARAWVVPLVIAISLGRGDGRQLAGAGILALALAVTVGRQALELVRLKWWLADDAFHLQSGILQIENKAVPVERIQNVDLVEPWLPRLLGLVEVRIETAGAGEGNLVLSYVSRADATQLREALARASTEATPDRATAQTQLVKTSTRELFIAGATANRAGALAVVAGAVASTLFEAGFEPPDFIGSIGSIADLLTPASWAALLIALLVVVGWLTSIAGTVLRFYGFELTQTNGDLRRQHGLLSRSSGVVPLVRIQTARIDRPLLRRLVGRASVVAESAGSVAASTDSGTGVMAPIMTDRDVPLLIEQIIGMKGPFEEHLSPVSPKAIRRGFIRVITIPAILAGVASFFFPLAATALLVVVPLGYWWARARYKSIGYNIDDLRVVARAGVLTRRTWLVPAHKIQSTVVRSSPFQRRLGLATLSIDTAGPGTSRVRIIDLDLRTATSHATVLARLSSETGLVGAGV